MPRPADLTVYVCGEEAVAPIALPGVIATGCRALSALATCELLGIDFAIDGDDWRVTGASPLPDLMRGGDALADALAKAFTA